MQNPSSVVMIRPLHFSVNAETAIDNAFQSQPAEGDRNRAIAEFDAMVADLKSEGVDVRLFDQLTEETPDAVFPNNWFSTHPSGLIVTYPMFAPSRRGERREDILAALGKTHKVSGVMDLSQNEAQAKFLEGTGAIVFDHRTRTAFMAQSLRADADLVVNLAKDLGYEPVIFTATDEHQHPIYHTNVMLSVGEKVTLVGLQTIDDTEEKRDVFAALSGRGNLMIELSQEQIAQFAGNAFEIQTPDGHVLVISETGWNALDREQREAIESAVRVIVPSVPTIEKSGGSVRCMMAGVYLPPKH